MNNDMTTTFGKHTRLDLRKAAYGMAQEMPLPLSESLEDDLQALAWVNGEMTTESFLKPDAKHAKFLKQRQLTIMIVTSLEKNDGNMPEDERNAFHQVMAGYAPLERLQEEMGMLIPA